LFLQIVNFLVLVIVLWAIAYRPILNMLKQRRETIAEGLNNARKAEEALANAEADKQKLLDEARAEAQRIVNDARSTAEKVSAQVKSDAQEEAKRIKDQARADAATEHDRMLADMRDQIVSLSVAAANHLIGSNLDEKKQHALVSDFFSKVPAGAKNLGESVTVVTAVPLNDTERKKFEKDLGAKNIDFQVDPAILGGVIVRGGGQQVDGSFASQLSSLRSSLS
jgi:F-type H+-transporting ATPase subunit b